MAKRTTSEIEKDYLAIRKYIDQHPTIASLKEVADALNLSVGKVETSLARHPRVFKSIQNLIANNQESKKAQKQDQKAVKSEARPKSELEPDKVNQKISDDFVIDASICGIDGILETLTQICATKGKIILTSITINELEKMQKYHDKDGKDAKKILAMAAGDYAHFECTLIDETVGIPDDCIIKYCADNKDHIILLTADKTMELKARAHGVKAQFFKHIRGNPVSTNSASDQKIDTLYCTRYLEGKLYISNFGNEFRSVRVISDGIEYFYGMVELKVGDDVYIATQKPDYMTFAHCKIVAISPENNCRVVFSRRLYNVDGINNLPKAGYKSFMRDFKHRVFC